jgi:hypothetical protein
VPINASTNTNCQFPNNRIIIIILINIISSQTLLFLHKLFAKREVEEQQFRAMISGTVLRTQGLYIS